MAGGGGGGGAGGGGARPAPLPSPVIMREGVRDGCALTGEGIGVKPAGGIRTAKDALRYLVTVHETAGPDWLDNHWFRFGASSLPNDLILQPQRLAIGAYPGPDYVPDAAPSLHRPPPPLTPTPP